MARILTTVLVFTLFSAGAFASPDPPADPNRQEMAGLARQRATQEDNGGAAKDDPVTPPSAEQTPPATPPATPPPPSQQPPREPREGGDNTRR